MNDWNTEVAGQYELNVESMRKGRGAWIFETDRGLKLLKEYRGSVKRLEFEELVLGAVAGAGSLRVDQYVRNKEGELLSTASDGIRYVVKDWFSDRECDLKDTGEILSAVRQIAVLHKLLRKVEPREEWNMKSMVSPPLFMAMEKHNRELKKARAFIRGKQQKNEFELCVIASFEPFYQQAVLAAEGMKKLYPGDEKGWTERYSICHGELNQHHILMGEGFVAIIEFNKLHLGVQMEDLYHFMRKVMEKHDWDLKLGMEMLEAYGRVTPLDAFDRQYLKYLFLYPEKYWKQINFYFNASKAWIPARNLEKLKSLGRQSLARERFIEAIK